VALLLEVGHGHPGPGRIVVPDRVGGQPRGRSVDEHHRHGGRLVGDLLDPFFAAIVRAADEEAHGADMCTSVTSLGEDPASCRIVSADSPVGGRSTNTTGTAGASSDRYD
jgi:hypothetical protein